MIEDRFMLYPKNIPHNYGNEDRIVIYTINYINDNIKPPIYGYYKDGEFYEAITDKLIPKKDVIGFTGLCSFPLNNIVANQE